MKSKICKKITKIIFSIVGVVSLVTIIIPLFFVFIDWFVDDDHDLKDSVKEILNMFMEMIKGVEYV